MAKYLSVFLLTVACFIGCKEKPYPEPPIEVPQASLQYRGADLSFLPIIEAEGTKYYLKSGQQYDALSIMKNSGMNMVRLRLWHSSLDTHSTLAEVETFAQKIKGAGLNWWLDFHYSDTWADPGNQTIPAAWKSLSFSVLADSVYNYTYRVMSDLKAKNILPVIVQIGNETNSGMLWDKGKVGGSFDTNWPNYAALVKKGIDAVKAVDPSIKIMLHFAGTNGAQWFYNNLKTQGVNYDVIGLSYYYWWHLRNLSELQTDLNALATTFDKDIFIAETAYPFTTAWNDNTNNILGATTALLTGYEATPAGQLKYLTDLRLTIHNIPNNRGIGFCYWAPDWVAFRGATATNGSPWENLALFDFGNKALVGWDAFAQ
jgi:arabinogalactan endo-1,4-beta-galactosidase